MSKEETLQKLQQLKKQKQSNQFYADRLNITVEEVKELLKELKTTDTYFVHTEGTSFPETATTTTWSQKVNSEKGTLESEVTLDFEPKDDTELARLHKVDLEKFVISSYWTKQRGEKFTSSLLCRLRKPEDLNIESFTNFLNTFKNKYQPLPKEIYYNDKQSVDILLSLADFHIDKLDIKTETIEEKKAMYLKTLNELILQARNSYKINKIVFVIGNDLLHTDTIQGTTTSGTPVENSITWNKAYEEAFELMVAAITELSSKCEQLEVILVQGNHARTKEYYLAHALSVYFSKDKSITFDREFASTKHTQLGVTFLGFHHGNTKIDDLPLVFATSTETSAKFGSSKFRTVITGDKHFYMAKDIKGVVIQQMPSLSGTDRWHSDNNFINSQRAGVLLVFHPVKGKIAEFQSIL